MFEAYVAAMVILLIAPLLITLISFPRKKKYSAEEYKLRLRQSIVTLVLIILATVLNIIRSQTSIKAFSYAAVAVCVATLVYSVISLCPAKKK